MSTSIDLFTKRYIQITLMFMLFTWIYQYGHIPHANWVVITGALIYAGFDPSTVLKRAYMRFYGTVTGIAAVVIVWHVIHLDYRFLIFLLVLAPWGMVFFQNIPYRRFMIMTTIFSDVITEAQNPAPFSLQYYMLDRYIAISLVFGICVIVEYIWFGRSNMTRLNCEDLLQSTYQNLHQFYQMIHDKRMTRAKLFKQIAFIHQEITHLKQIMADQEFECVHDEFFMRTNELVGTILDIFRKMVCLVYLRANNKDSPAIPSLLHEIEQALAKS